jgi:hypothetical protein
LDEQAMEIRLLADHRHDLVVERTRMQNRLRWHLVTLSPELEASLKRGSLADARQLERVDRQLRRMASQVLVSQDGTQAQVSGLPENQENWIGSSAPSSSAPCRSR